ncbi:MAG: D-cysteine desulfhydrase family protein [Anaerolineae bacterium]|nr:D-cysteine desulfhydrase family protein [Anaerolineae bacterium]
MTTNAIHTLESLPRVQLAHLPTPIEPLPNLSKYLGGVELWIKRDDQTGLATGGNKARKLEYLLGEARKVGADSLITAGSTQSNHARQTAAAAARCGLECHLALYAPDSQPPDQPEGNILLDLLLGATIHWTDEHAPYRQTIRHIEEKLKAAGRRPYVVPYGGSSPIGMMGYVTAMQELINQSELVGVLDAVVFASSSGGTQAGMILGSYLTGWSGKARLLGISVDEREATIGPRISNLINQGAQTLGLDWWVNDDVVDINDDYLGGGYAIVGDAEREAIKLLAQHEGILVDPVYTGRALAGLIDLIRRNEFKPGQKVLFWHTGGTAALFAFGNELGM